MDSPTFFLGTPHTSKKISKNRGKRKLSPRFFGLLEIKGGKGPKPSAISVWMGRPS